MARIRSVHPGLFTDEAFASLSFASRIFLIGIWTECDDRGAFEWKPVGLKMRVLAADKVDVEPLLEELSKANIIKKFLHGGRQYGVVRNFCRFQRPKKPKYLHTIPQELLPYVGIGGRGGELDEDEAHSFPKKGEKPPQMKEGEERKKDPSQGKKDSEQTIKDTYAPPAARPNGRVPR